MRQRGVLVQVLGPVRAWRDGHELDLGPAGRRAVLSLLVLARGQPMSRAELVDTIWGDRPPPTAANVLQTHVKHLRRQLEPQRRPHAPSTALPAVGDGYALRIRDDEVDLVQFRRLAAAATAARRDGDLRRAAVGWGEALQLWRGGPLADIPLLADHPKVLALAGERQTALAHYCEAMLDSGAAGEILPLVEEVAAGQPFDEAAQARLIRAYHAVGKRAEALARYRQIRSRLVDELGVEPGPVLAAAHVALLRGPMAVTDPQVSERAETATAATADGVAPAAPPTPDRGRPPGAVVPTQLPADVYGFTGRDVELRRLDELLPVADSAAPLVIVAICGTAGVGKTALAVHWAHQVRSRFPGGQLYLDLHGHDHEQPMTATDALARLLSGIGVPGPEIPVDRDERAARLRSELADRPVLMVLDNAVSVEQLRPLLPGTPSCLVLVTSRDSLAGLVALHGAHRVTLDPLPLSDTFTLLRRLIGARAQDEPRALAALAEQCARLPLVLRVAAELAATRPTSSLADLVSELADQRRRLHLLDAGGDPRAAVGTVLSWSYRHLAAEEAIAFRRLGLHPGTEIDPYAAAALAGVDVDQAERTLTALARAHLIQPVGVHRWTMHDLLRAYAAQACHGQDPAAERTAALGRLLDHYLATAAAAMDLLHPADRHHRPRDPAPEGLIRPLDGAAAARAWLDVELPTLVAVCGYAARHGWPRHVTALSATLGRHVESGRYADALRIHGHAWDAARQADDRAGEAYALTSLGVVYRLYGRYREAIDHHERALALHRGGGDRYGQARTLSNLGIVYERLGQREPAIEHQRQALDIYRQLGDRYGEAGALTNLGNGYTELGRYSEAAELFGRSLQLFRMLGDRVGEAIGLTNLGDAHLELGRYETAVGYQQRALTLFRATGHRLGEATALSNLGRVNSRLGRHDLAIDDLDLAVRLFQETGHRYGEASALNTLGEALHAAGRPAEALARHTAALTIAVQTRDRDERTRASRGIAHIKENGGAPAAAGRRPLALPLAADIPSAQPG